MKENASTLPFYSLPLRRRAISLREPKESSITVASLTGLVLHLVPVCLLHHDQKLFNGPVPH